MGRKILLGEVCPDLKNVSVRPVSPDVQKRVNYMTRTIKKNGGEIANIVSQIQRMIAEKRNYMVTIDKLCDITHITEIKPNAGKFMGKVIASRLKLGCIILYSRNGHVTPVTWENYKAIWDELVPAPKRLPNDKIRRNYPTDAERMFADGQQKNLMKKTSSGGYIPRQRTFEDGDFVVVEYHTYTL